MAQIGLFFVFLAFSFSVVSAEKITLDSHNEQSRAWVEVTCIYNDDYNDFWVFGCPIKLEGDDDKFPERNGFWTPCSAQRCEIHYFGGNGVPQAKTLTLSMYLQGSPEIMITSKYSPLDEEYSNITKITETDGTGWFEKTINLTNSNGRALVLNFTLTSSPNDVLLLDKIELDLGDDVTAPTESPAPTTVVPIEEDVVTLETDNDYWVLWDADCNFVDDYEDFWVFGCPVNATEQDEGTVKGGYWSACKARSSQPYCRLRYVGNFENSPIFEKEAFSFKIYGNLVGDASVNVTLQDDLADVNCDNCEILEIISNEASTDGQWISPTVLLEGFSSEIGVINIDLYPGGGGQVLIDKIEVSLRERNNPSTTTAAPTTTSITSPTNPTTNRGSAAPTTTNPTSPETTTKGSANKNERNIFFLFVPLILLNIFRFNNGT